MALTRLAAFPDLSADERKALQDAATSTRTVAAGRDIIHEGEPVDRLYFVADGWACRFKTTGGGNRQIVAFAVPGDAANLDSLLFERPDFGVRTLTAVTFLTMPRQQALLLAATHPGISRALVWLALLDNATLRQWSLCLGRHSAPQRLAHLLCELSVRLDGEAGEKSSFSLPLTQEHIADALGLTSVHVNRTFQYLRSLGLVVTGQRTITIPDVIRLRRLGDFDPAYLHRGSEMPAPTG